MDDLIKYVLKTHDSHTSKSFSEKIVDDVENTFLNMEKVPEAKSRTDERVELMKELRELRKKLDSLKNARNIKTAKYNNSVAAKRKVVRSRIDEIKYLLENIKDEEAGSKLTAGDLLARRPVDGVDDEQSSLDWKGVY